MSSSVIEHLRGMSTGVIRTPSRNVIWCDLSTPAQCHPERSMIVAKRRSRGVEGPLLPRYRSRRHEVFSISSVSHNTQKGASIQSSFRRQEKSRSVKPNSFPLRLPKLETRNLRRLLRLPEKVARRRISFPPLALLSPNSTAFRKHALTATLGTEMFFPPNCDRCTSTIPWLETPPAKA